MKNNNRNYVSNANVLAINFFSGNSPHVTDNNRANWSFNLAIFHVVIMSLTNQYLKQRVQPGI